MYLFNPWDRGLTYPLIVLHESLLAKVERAPSARVAPLQMTAATGKNFWEGEWVCADCGYIYDVDDCGGLYLEQQVKKGGLKCFSWLSVDVMKSVVEWTVFVKQDKENKQ